jgi:hypothetical protein
MPSISDKSTPAVMIALDPAQAVVDRRGRRCPTAAASHGPRPGQPRWLPNSAALRPALALHHIGN